MSDYCLKYIADASTKDITKSDILNGVYIKTNNTISGKVLRVCFNQKGSLIDLEGETISTNSINIVVPNEEKEYILIGIDNLTSFEYYGDNITMDIDKLSNNVLNRFYVEHSELLDGDISSFSKSSYETIVMSYSSISGLLSDISKEATTINFRNNANIRGTISDLADIEGLETAILVNCSRVTGSISSLSNIPTLIEYQDWGSGTEHTWPLTTLRSPSSYIITSALSKFATSEDFDRFLINMSTCTKPSSNNLFINVSDLSVTRTSDSDYAVETLKGLGYTMNFS